MVFGDYTGIDIHEESPGILPSVAWKRAKYNQSWYPGETVSVGIGQSFWTVTPLQLAHALSILVNNGEVKRPHLLKATSQFEYLVEDGESKRSVTATPYEIEDMPPITLENNKNWRIVLDAMHNTVQKIGATGYNAFKGHTYDAAGKTGSAQVARLGDDEKYDASKTAENKRDNAMFIAYAPYEKPEIVVAVAIENVAKGGGATNAAPVARQIMDQYFGDRVIISQNKALHPLHDDKHSDQHSVGGH